MIIRTLPKSELKVGDLEKINGKTYEVKSITPTAGMVRIVFGETDKKLAPEGRNGIVVKW